jgi:hypothetical protein
MPVHTTERVEKRLSSLQEKLEKNRESLDPEKLRDLRKKIKRAQRKHHRLTVEADRKAAVAKKKAKESEAGEADAPAEEKKEG